MIQSFGDKRTQGLYEDKIVREFQAIARPAKRKLTAIDAATRLERLKADLLGFYSIRINDQWRVIFRWADGHAHDVRISDYHGRGRAMDDASETDGQDFAPVTPGEMLKDEFLAGFGLSQAELARALGVSPNRIAGIVNNRRRITADTALRLGLFFGTSPEFWPNLQTRYDLKLARRTLSPEEAGRIEARRAA